MSKIDTLLNIDQSIRLRGLTKLSRAQLEVDLANNAELRKLRHQVSQGIDQLNYLVRTQNKIQEHSLLLQKQILENQIREIELRETQNFHKKRIFKCREYLNTFSKLSDPVVIGYFMKNFMESIERLINESKEWVIELSDKEFCLQLQNQINEIKANAGATETSDAIVEDLTELFELSEIENDKITLLENEYKEIKNQKGNLANQKKEHEGRYLEEIMIMKRRKGMGFFLAIISGGALMITFVSLNVVNLEDVVKYALLCLLLFVLSLYLTIRSNKNIKELASNEPNENLQANIDKLSNRLNDINKRLLEARENVKEYKLKYSQIYKAILEVHSDFRRVSFVLPDPNSF